MKIEIIKLEPKNWSEYRKLRLEALQTEPQAYLDTYENTLNRPDSYWVNRLQQVENGESWLLFAKLDNNLVGMIGAYVEAAKSKPTIVSFFVSKKARGLGIGRKLIQALLNELAKDESIKEVKLAVNKSQITALHIYESLGFKKVNEEKRNYADREETSYLMERAVRIPQ